MSIAIIVGTAGIALTLGWVIGACRNVKPNREDSVCMAKLPNGWATMNYEQLSVQVQTLTSKLKDADESIQWYKRTVRHLESKCEGYEEDKRYLQERIDNQKTRHRNTRDRLKEAQDELIMRSDLKHIKFTARLPDGSLVATCFKLGRGNCGLEVQSLRWEEQPDRYVVHQLCTNGDLKSFEYARNDVLGRIEFRKGQ